jgi:hypothetical protein
MPLSRHLNPCPESSNVLLNLFQDLGFGFSEYGGFRSCTLQTGLSILSVNKIIFAQFRRVVENVSSAQATLISGVARISGGALSMSSRRLRRPAWFAIWI